MRKAAVPLLFLILLLVPQVSAARLSYHPDKVAFESFLNSSSPFTVVAGNDIWARAWAYYVDQRLLTVKPRGNGTLVLVGNVYDNPLMRKLWNRTGLPENASLLPSIVVLNGTVLITGTEDNIYLTERAFQNLWNPSRNSVLVFLGTVLFLVIVFLAALRGDKTHAGSFYAIVVSLYVLWTLTSWKVAFTDSFLRTFLNALEFSVGGVASSPLSAIMGFAFRFISPVEENVLFIHWLLILLILSFSFYLTPKRARDLGFIVVGFLLMAPMFRLGLDSVGGDTLGLASLVMTLAIISNVTFSPEWWKALLQTLVLSAFTLLVIAINPYLSLIPVIFVLAFPKRRLRNYAYLAITALGTVVMYKTLGLGISIPRSVYPCALRCEGKFLFDGGLMVLTAVYAWAKGGGRIRMKGQTAFFLLMTLVYVPLTLLVPSLFPYDFMFLAALTVRLLHRIIPGT
ncbi:hypothetical protein [Thermococcus sp.]|uniref:hypothetical protein n=1 Tax=Thermococcus sp. TaxID=35749 RepID=UPI0026210B24|nr:hypothetical protein [Thermococcus sp.]